MIKGDFFGDVALGSISLRRTATVVATSFMELLVIDERKAINKKNNLFYLFNLGDFKTLKLGGSINDSDIKNRAAFLKKMEIFKIPDMK